MELIDMTIIKLIERVAKTFGE